MEITFLCLNFPRRSWMSRSMRPVSHDADGSVVLRIDGLLPDSRYAVEVTLALGAREARRSHVAYVVTAPARSEALQSLKCNAGPGSTLVVHWRPVAHHTSNTAENNTQTSPGGLLKPGAGTVPGVGPVPGFVYHVRLDQLRRPKRMCSAGADPSASLRSLSRVHNSESLGETSGLRHQACQDVSGDRMSFCTTNSSLTLAVAEAGVYRVSVRLCVKVESCLPKSTESTTNICFHCSCLPSQAICSSRSSESVDIIQHWSVKSAQKNFNLNESLNDNANITENKTKAAYDSLGHHHGNGTWLVQFRVSPDFIGIIKYYNISINGKFATVAKCAPMSGPAKRIVLLDLLADSPNNLSVSAVTQDYYSSFSNITLQNRAHEVFYLVAPNSCCVVLPPKNQRFLVSGLSRMNDGGLATLLSASTILGLLAMLCLCVFTARRWCRVGHTNTSAAQQTCQFDVEETTSIAREYDVLNLQVDPCNVEKVSCVGSGHFSEVWLGHLNSTKNSADFRDNAGAADGDVHYTKIAIKIPKRMASTRDVRNFLREASLLKKAQSIHVVRLLGVLLQPDRLAYIMEHMTLDLQKYLHLRKDSLSYQDQVRLIEQAATGIKYLHDLKIIHCDLSSRNCLLEDSHRPLLKLADFGQALQLADTEPIEGE
ncbi:Serine-threonine/tyrosine-protein kinase catalytic domain [Trinorchestia longiramus]|nr:Serine-threonine/tyrosine-protein kinase catalytic domain [Trinorchestia longiramus]